MSEDAGRIILVEDSPTQAAKMSAILEEAGYDTASFASAEEGLRAIGESLPDLLIVDYYLPGLRGDELCRRLRLNRETRHLPVLMFTADETHAAELRGLEAGADDYISKSADEDVLMARIRGLVRKGQESRTIESDDGPLVRDIKVLVVDDSPTFREKVALELEGEGYVCERADSGEECLKRLGGEAFDCVVVDLVMPGMDGIEVCRRVANLRREGGKFISVLMLTSREGKDDLTRALEAGADDFVGKSSDLAVLKGRMRALLRRNFYLEENRRITDRLRSRELEAARALVEKQAAQERARLADKLEATNRDLEAANKELEAFCYSVSHDLRSPLRTIDGFSLALLEDYGEKLDEEGRDCLNRVRAGCLRMAQLIDDLLGLSNVTRREFSSGKVDLSKTAAEVIRALRDGDRERSFAVGIQPGLTVRGDYGLLKVLLENLLGNAWKFTTKTPKPEIRFGFKKDRGEYFVEDNGAGFDMAYAKKLFGAFQRLHSQEEFPGTGIGLATVQRVVHRHGGRIRAEGAPGKGAAFYFTLSAEGAGDER